MTITPGPELSPAKPRARSGQLNHTAKPPQSHVAAPHDHYSALVDLALCWALPWPKRDYPGIHRGTQQLLGRHVTYGAIQHWRKGRRPPPLDLLVALRRHIHETVATGQQLVSELDSEISKRQDEPRRLTGCCAIGSDGYDRRGHGARGRSRAQSADTAVRSSR
jgi:hypothetical protein